MLYKKNYQNKKRWSKANKIPFFQKLCHGYEKALVEINFPEYKKFDYVNAAYSNFIQKLMKAVSAVKNKRIKRNSQQRFDSEISEKLIIFDRLFKK